MRVLPPAALLTLSILTIWIPGVSAMQSDARQAEAAATSPYSYADIADLATTAPVVLHARIADSAMVEPERSEEHTSELQSLMRISYAVFCLKKNTITPTTDTYTSNIQLVSRSSQHTDETHYTTLIYCQFHV